MSVHHFLFWLEYPTSTLNTKKNAIFLEGNLENGFTENWRRESVFEEFPQCVTGKVL